MTPLSRSLSRFTGTSSTGTGRSVTLRPAGFARMVSPFARLTMTPGMVTVLSTPPITVGLPAVFWTTMIPTAPSFCAFFALTVKLQKPRSTSAMVPAGMSNASQPSVRVPPGVPAVPSLTIATLAVTGPISLSCAPNCGVRRRVGLACDRRRRVHQHLVRERVGPLEHLHAAGPPVRRRAEVGVVEAAAVLGLRLHGVAGLAAASVVRLLEVAGLLVEAVAVQDVVEDVVPVEEVRHRRTAVDERRPGSGRTRSRRPTRLHHPGCRWRPACCCRPCRGTRRRCCRA